MNVLSFVNPLALTALLALPVLWWLLRFTPPKPQTVRFPPLRLLLELVNREETPDKTPWWLLLLRMALAAAVIIAVAGPVLAPRPSSTAASRQPLLMVVDDGWAAAAQWDQTEARLLSLIREAEGEGRTITLATTAPGPAQNLASLNAAEAAARARTIRPVALSTDRLAALTQIKAAVTGPHDIIWLSDGRDSASARPFAEGLLALAPGTTLSVAVPEHAPLALAPPKLNDAGVAFTVLRDAAAGPASASVIATSAKGLPLGEATALFAPGAASATARLDLPLELRNTLRTATIAGERHAGARQLFDDRSQRRSVALLSSATQEQSQPLLSPLHYVSAALEPFATLERPAAADDVGTRLDGGLSMLVLADVGVLPEGVQAAVGQWVERGGLLLRFAGPRLAAASDALVPVLLRQGGRAFGSSLSWEQPQGLQPFPAASPFAGLVPDPEVTVRQQVLAEPVSDLAAHSWANLADGTPLITAAPRGKGVIVLVHTTPNADWSNLPLSGLFVDMMQKLVEMAPPAGSGGTTMAATADTAFAPVSLMDGFGDLVPPGPAVAPIAAAAFDRATATALTPPGLYARGAEDRAINLALAPADLTTIGSLPAGVQRLSNDPAPRLALAPALFTAALLLFLLDMLASLWLGGAFHRGRTAALALALLLPLPPSGHAQTADEFALQASLETRLAYVETGDAAVDAASRTGLTGLGFILRDRTSVSLAAPMAVTLERDEISFFPLLYWPIRAETPKPSAAALARLTAYMKQGGTLFFDLGDDGLTDQLGGQTQAGVALRRITAELDLPPLEPVPANHVLTRSFYLLKSFPGRSAAGQLWVEQQPQDNGAPTTSDGVSPVLIGSNDYAAAWALDDQGNAPYAMAAGGEEQREMAWRTGVNIVMYALTGNYKSDQVHLETILKRLGE